MVKDFSNLVTSFFCQHDRVIQELNKAGVVNALADISQISQISKHDKCVILYSSLPAFLGEIVQSNKDLSSAIKEWKENTLSLLDVTRTDRSKITLISSCDIVENVSNFEAFSGSKITYLPTHPNPQFSELIASYLMTNQQDIKRLVDELEARTSPLSENSRKMLMSIEELSALCIEQQQRIETISQTEITVHDLNLKIKNLDKALTDVNIALIDEQEINKISKTLIADYRLKIENIKAARETAEFEKRKYRREKERSNRKVKELNEELGHLRLLRNSAVDNLKRENSKLLCELTLLRRENDKMKTGTFHNANNALQKVKQKLARRSGQKLDENQVSIIATSDFFDINWYLKTYPDVADSDLHPVEHYLLYGYKEGRLPSPDFNGDWYLEQNPDVAKLGVNPLLHFEMYGRNEGRKPSLKMISSKNS